jgi:hypothetical protein
MCIVTSAPCRSFRSSHADVLHLLVYRPQPYGTFTSAASSIEFLPHPIRQNTNHMQLTAIKPPLSLTSRGHVIQYNRHEPTTFARVVGRRSCGNGSEVIRLHSCYSSCSSNSRIRSVCLSVRLSVCLSTCLTVKSQSDICSMRYYLVCGLFPVSPAAYVIATIKSGLFVSPRRLQPLTSRLSCFWAKSVGDRISTPAMTSQRVPLLSGS